MQHVLVSQQNFSPKRAWHSRKRKERLQRFPASCSLNMSQLYRHLASLISLPQSNLVLSTGLIRWIGHRRDSETDVSSVSPSSSKWKFDSLRRRADARSVRFRIYLRWPIHIIKPVDKTKLSCNTPTDALPQFTHFIHRCLKTYRGFWLCQPWES